MNKEQKCTELVFERDTQWPRWHECGKPGKVLNEKGEWRCNIHSDEAKARRQSRANELYEAKSRKRMARIDRMVNAEKCAGIISELMTILNCTQNEVVAKVKELMASR